MRNIYSVCLENTLTALEGLSPEHFLNLIILVLNRYTFNFGVLKFIQDYCKERRAHEI